MIYVIVGLGLTVAFAVGHRLGYIKGVDDTFRLVKDWDDICGQIENALKDFDENK
jgi:hypothetical protein